ncbi:MAG: 30S ribosomal protein S16 [Candidatus Nealsonbacteria bacterium]|jgi:small subunit ribosomal protein S16|nr:30S ribosomal protein S16 [Candidatus Nealsonbacteria bacterium]
MLVIRFLRTGKKNQPSFKLVVVEKTRSSTSGRFVEQVGFYNPLTKEKVFKGDRIKYWLSVGAQPSNTVYNLLVSEKIVLGKKIPKHKKSKKEVPGGEQVPHEANNSPTGQAKKEKEKTTPKIPIQEKPKEEKVKNPE